jgi:probable dihydroxyacetone kinase regulator
MAKRDRTKQAIADTLRTMVLTKDIDKIGIGEIVEACGMNRATFYYHFKDKQDLICWIFDHDFNALEDTNRNDTVLDELLEHLYGNRRFYAPALRSSVQNNLSDHLYEIVYASVSEMLRRKCGSRTIQKDQGEHVCAFLTNGMTGMIRRWAESGMKERFYEYSADSPFLLQDCIELLADRYAQ